MMFGIGVGGHEDAECLEDFGIWGIWKGKWIIKVVNYLLLSFL